MRKLVLIAFISILAGCNSKDSVVNPHVQKQTEDEFQYPANTNFELQGLHFGDTKDQLDKMRGNSRSVYSQILKPLEDKLINAQTLSNPDLLQGNFTSWMHLYTDALLEAMNNNPTPEVKKSFDNFIQLTFRHCTNNLRGCSLLNAFRVTPNSAKLLSLKAELMSDNINKCTKDLNSAKEACKSQNKKSDQCKAVAKLKSDCDTVILNKYKYLAQSNNLKISRNADAEYIISYLEHSHLLSKVDGSNVIKSYNNDLFNTIITFFETTESNFDKSCSIIKKYNTWNYSRLDIGNGNISMKKLFELSTKCDLYTDDKKLTQSFKDAINTIQSSSGSNENLSFLHKAKLALKSTPDKKMFEQFGHLKTLENFAENNPINYDLYNEYFYVIDRLYNGHIGLDEAQQILEVADRDYNQLLRSWDLYNQLQILFAVMDTRTYLNKALFNTENKNTSQELFVKAVEDSEPVAEKWATLQNNMNILQNAVKTIIDSADNDQMRDDYEVIERKIRYVSSTVKFLATYPSMMALAHLLAEEDGEVQINSFWGGKITLSATTIYETLWNGNGAPWFDFSDQLPINKFYLLYSFDYALKSNFVLLQRDSDNQSKKDLEFRYFSVLLSKYLAKERSALEKEFYERYLAFSHSSSQAVANKLVCNYELDPKATRSPQISMTLDDLDSRIHSGVGSSASYGTLSKTFVSYAAKLLGTITDSVDPKLILAEQIVKIAEHNNVSNEAINKAKNEIARTKKLVSDIVKEMGNKFKAQSQCIKRLALVENYYMYLAFEAEKEYLGQVWEDIATLQDNTDESLSQEIANLNNLPDRYRDTTKDINKISESEANFDRITGQKSFIYSQFDFLMRLRSSLTNQTIAEHHNQHIDNVVQIWNSLYPEVFKKPISLDRQWQIILPPKLDESSLAKDRGKDVVLNWTNDKEEFIKQGLRVFRGDNNSFAKWFINNNKLDSLKDSLTTAVYLYQTEHQGLIAKDQRLEMKDVMKVMQDIITFTEMNAYELELASIFGLESKIPLSELVNILVDKSQRESIHPYSLLYDKINSSIGTSSNLFKMEPSQLANMKSPLANSYLLSLNLNDRLFTLYFDQHKWMDQELLNTYSKISTHYLTKIIEFSNALKKGKNIEIGNTIYRLENGSPVTLRDTSTIPLNDNLIHPKKLDDMNIFIEKFSTNTKNIFRTKGLHTERAQ